MCTAGLRLLLVLVLALGGCSAVRIAYNQADHIVLWMADDYFDLSPEQEQAFRDEVERFHAWHRRTQLPDYVSLLDAVQQRLRSGARTEDADWLVDALQARYRAMVLHAHEDAARLLAMLSDEQLQATQQQFDKSNRKYVKENGIGATPDEQRRLRAKRHVERIEHWTGPLDAAQEARVRALSRSLPLITEAAYRERLRRQAEFLALLQSRKHPAFAARLRDWLIDWDRTRGAQYQPQYTEYVRARAGMSVQVIGVLSAEQRQHVSAVIQRYQRAFRELAAQAASQRLTMQP